MNPDDVAVFESLLRRIAQALGPLKADVDFALQLLAARRRKGAPTSGARGHARDLIDEGRLSVRWNGRECRLGQTLLYRLFCRLASAPNRHVSHEELLEDVWGGMRTPSAVRMAVLGLRRKLVDSGLAELAGVIGGESAGSYGLWLDRLPRARGSDEELTRI